MNLNRILIGTYTESEQQGSAEGIYSGIYEADSGNIRELRLAVRSPNPSFIVPHPNGSWVYAVNELGGQGMVSSFEFQAATGALVPINSCDSGGEYPCHISLDSGADWVFAANYEAGSIAAFPIRKDGSLGSASSIVRLSGSGPHATRQEDPHAHMISELDIDGKIYAADLGTDTIRRYIFANGRLVQDSGGPALSPGMGPRHFVLNPRSRVLYVVNELIGSVSAFSAEKTAEGLSWKEFQTVPSCEASAQEAASCAEIALHPSGRFLYMSNRGPLNNVVVFSVDRQSNRLEQIQVVPSGGSGPRSFVIDGEGKHLLVANQHSDSVWAYRIEAGTGLLGDGRQVAEVPSPVCVVIG